MRSFWNGSTGRDLRARGRNVQFMALYVFTGPNVHKSGLYYVALPTLCHESGFSEIEARCALDELAGAGFAFYDPACELMWVPTMAHWQVGPALKPEDKQVVGLARWIEQFKKHAFARAFYQRYQAPFNLPPIDFPKGQSRAKKAPSVVVQGGPPEPPRSHIQNNAVTVQDSNSTGQVPAADAPGPSSRSWSTEACEDWMARFECVPSGIPGGEIGKWLKPLVEKLGWGVVRPAWQRYLAGENPKYVKPKSFANRPGPWLNKARARVPIGTNGTTAADTTINAVQNILAAEEEKRDRALGVHEGPGRDRPAVEPGAPGGQDPRLLPGAPERDDR